MEGSKEAPRTRTKGAKSNMVMYEVFLRRVEGLGYEEYRNYVCEGLKRGSISIFGKSRKNVLQVLAKSKMVQGNFKNICYKFNTIFKIKKF